MNGQPVSELVSDSASNLAPGLAPDLAPELVADPRPRRFDFEVARNGYAWWYLDALADDGQLGMTLIFFVGSVFSPHYARARQRDGGCDPERFCALNIALYRPGGDRWSLCEQRKFARSRDAFSVGASELRWQGGELLATLDAREVRFGGRAGRPIRGRVRLRPAQCFAPRIALDRWRDRPRHRWYPVAPHAEVEVELDEPALRFRGSGYHDVNEGDEPLEAGFSSWNWSRARLGDDGSAALYDVVDPSGQLHPRGFRFDLASGKSSLIDARELGPAMPLPGTRWRVARATRADPETTPTLVRTVEDTPFYTRSFVASRLLGRSVTAVHESVDLGRFARPGIQFLLRFKTRRAP